MSTSIRRKSDMSGDTCKFRGIGAAFTAQAGETTNHDFKITEARLVEAPFILCRNQVWGDSISFQVIDVDNVYGLGAGALLDEFATDWYLDPDVCSQPPVQIWYSAQIDAGIWIRLKYKSLGTVNPEIKINFSNHKFLV